jgi:uncharacterized protein YggU (UPF0235/DUF167 family)
MSSEPAVVEVLVTPRAAADSVGPMVDGVLRIRVTRPPTDGEANEAVRRLLARALGIAPSRVVLVAGGRARRKRFAVSGVPPGAIPQRLAGGR